jgi:hypothetical protein
MRHTREVRLDAPPERTWQALTGAAWRGPLRLSVGDHGYAGTLTALGVDEDERVVGARAGARRLVGWGGVAAALELRPALAGAELSGEVTLTGEAGGEAADALLDEIEARLRRAVAEVPEPEEAGPVAAALDRVRSPADDPAWRRRLAGRAAIAVALGVAAGLAGARWGRRR